MVHILEKFEALDSMPLIKREIISHLFDFVSRKKQNQWWHYKGEFKYDGKEYLLECDCKMDNQNFTYRNLMIEHKQVVIDVNDMIARGLLN